MHSRCTLAVHQGVNLIDKSHWPAKYFPRSIPSCRGMLSMFFELSLSISGSDGPTSSDSKEMSRFGGLDTLARHRYDVLSIFERVHRQGISRRGYALPLAVRRQTAGSG